jgi:hypothetical protein
MDNNITAQIIGIVETSALPEEIKTVYREKLKKDGANNATIESIKGYLREMMAADAKNSGFEPAADDPQAQQALADFEAATSSLKDRYTATMQDLEERIDNVMNSTSQQLEKIQAQGAKEELTA